MPIFRKKPVKIEARQFLDAVSGYDLVRWINKKQHANIKAFAVLYDGVLLIPTLAGEHTASKKDWIIKGVAGEFYPCKPDIFRATHNYVGYSHENDLDFCVICGGTIEAGSCGTCTCHADTDEGFEEREREIHSYV